MSVVEFVKEAGWVAYAQGFMMLVGLVWSLVCAGFLAARWRVPAFLALVPAGLIALTGAIGASLSARAVQDALQIAEPAQRAMLMAAGTSEMLHGDILLLAVVPPAMLLTLGAAAGGVRPPRAYGAPALVFFLLGLVSLLPLADLFYQGDAMRVLMRVLVYGLGVIPVALSLLNNGMQTNGREASVTATIAYFCVVAAMETAMTARGYATAFGAIATVDPAQRNTILTYAVAELTGAAWLANLRLLLCFVAVLIAALRPVAAPTEEEILAGKFNPSPIRSLGTVFAFGVIAMWLIAANATDPAETLTRLLTFYQG